nr:hypothetical protein [Micromonospora sp. DSM 115978]
MSAYLIVVAVLLAVAFGFAGGMATYQKSRRWCPRCGTTLTCQLCHPRPQGRNTRWQ